MSGRDVVVVGRTLAASSVVLLDLAPANDVPLSPWQPGAHIDVTVPAGERQYSLMPSEPGRWRIGVLREPDGRGGSLWLHDSVAVGDTLHITGPSNHFSFRPVAGTTYLFLAAGIGITPIASMVAAAQLAGVDYEFHYSGRTREAMLPYEGILHVSDEGTRIDLASVLATDAEVYCCGPAHFIEAVEALARPGRLHVERFEAKALTPPVWHGPFEVEFELSGETLEVPPEKSILEVAEEAGIFVLSSCREGTCGTCETTVVDGEVDHRDSILTPGEQALNTVMYICVSRAACPRLVLEL
ncbi:MAG: PDR/VanB family oxidoreductase [Actinomycetota bacterium]